MVAEDKFDLVVVGSGGVGKSCLTIRFLKDDFSADYDPTVEENYRKTIAVDGVPCQLSIVDTAGQHEYEALRDQHLNSGDGFLLVFSFDYQDSLKEVLALRDRILMSRNKKRLPMVAVCNKCDLPEKEKKQDQATLQSTFANLKIPFYETSAKANIRVIDAFHELVRQCRKEAHKTTEKSGATDKKDKTNAKSSSGCACTIS